MDLHEITLRAVETGNVSQAFLGALIGGAVSLVGGLMGRSDQKKRDKAAAKAAQVPQVTKTDQSQKQTLTQSASQTSKTVSKNTTAVSLTALVKEAETAGFNPLTVLRAGLGGAFSSSVTEQTHNAGQTSTQTLTDNIKGTSTTTGHNAMAAVPQAPSVGSVIANAAGNAFNIYQQGQQQKANEAFQLKMQEAAHQQAMERQLQASQLQGRANFGTPYTVSAGPALSQGRTAALSGAPVKPTYETPTVTNPYKDGYVDTTVPDLAAAEERYGELGALPFAIRNYVADLLRNLTGTTTADRAKVRQGLVKDGTAALSQSLDAARARLAIMNGAPDPAFEGIKFQPGLSGSSGKASGGGGW